MIKELHKKLVDKEISAIELASEYLDRIDENDKELNSFISVTKESALETAAQIDKKISSGDSIGMLAGIPASIKDVIMTEGVKTTAGSRVLENYIASYDAFVVSQLKQEGMVMVGKNNCDEFAMGSTGENSAYGVTKNPIDHERVPGGSSSGSGVAVAADLSVYSIGTDTGGSVRLPAAFCGVSALKPTYGSFSRSGLIAMGSSLDQPGPIAKSVEDLEILFNVMKGKDVKDATSFDNMLDGSADLKGLKIGMPKEYFSSGVDSEVLEKVKEYIKKAEVLGAEIVEVSLPMTEYALAVYYIIMPAEVSSNLARFDGIRYGMSEQEAKDLLSVYTKTRGKYLGDEVKRRIMLGAYTLSAGYYDAYYKKAQAVRTLINEDFARVFKEVDMLMTPVAPTNAWKIGEKTDDPLKMYLEDVLTVPISVAGLPAIVVSGGNDSNGLPTGVQMVGAWKKEGILFNVGKILENN